METRTHPLLYVVATLVAVNIILTALLLMRGGGGGNPSALGPQRALPTTVTADERSRLFQDLKTLFNSRDLDGLYMFLDPVARVQMTKEQAKPELQKLLDFFGKIEDGVYSHYVFAGSQSGQDNFQLVYQLRVSGKQFHNAVLLINLAATGDEYHVMGFRLNGT